MLAFGGGDGFRLEWQQADQKFHVKRMYLSGWQLDSLIFQNPEERDFEQHRKRVCGACGWSMTSCSFTTFGW